MLKREDKTGTELIEKLRGWPHSSFSVPAGNRTARDDLQHNVTPAPLILNKPMPDHLKKSNIDVVPGNGLAIKWELPRDGNGGRSSRPNKFPLPSMVALPHLVLKKRSVHDVPRDHEEGSVSGSIFRWVVFMEE